MCACLDVLVADSVLGFSTGLQGGARGQDPRPGRGTAERQRRRRVAWATAVARGAPPERLSNPHCKMLALGPL
jgi:hypothetical protein